MSKGGISGVSGTTKAVFAIPTDNAKVWRLKNGSITFENGYHVAIEVEDGYIPHAMGTRGLTVTYCDFRSLKNQGSRVTGEVSMVSCINGRAMDSVDIAKDVEVILPAEMAESIAVATRKKTSHSRVPEGQTD
jgi:hypothetical protein